MNYRDMLLQDYFDESYDDYDMILDETAYRTQAELDAAKKKVKELEKAMSKAKDGKLRQGDWDSLKKKRQNIKDTEEVFAWNSAHPNNKVSSVEAIKKLKAQNPEVFAGKKKKTVNSQQGHDYRMLGAGVDDYFRSETGKKAFADFKKANPTITDPSVLKREFIKSNKPAIQSWQSSTANTNKGIMKAEKKAAKDAKIADEIRARREGAADAASGAAPSPSKISQAKAWAGGHKKQLAIAGGAAAGVAGAGVTASGVKSIADLKNTAKAKAAWKASGSNLPFEEWRKKQLTKAGIKTGIGAALTAAGAGGAAYAGLSKKFNEAEDLMFQYELVELEEAYLEGYYGQAIAESMGFDSEYDLVCYAESMDSYDDYDEAFDEDLELPYFG